MGDKETDAWLEWWDEEHDGAPPRSTQTWDAVHSLIRSAFEAGYKVGYYEGEQAQYPPEEEEKSNG